MSQLWMLIIAVGLFTAATRIVPLLLAGRQGQGKARRPAWLESLGSCLLAAMAVVVILPHLRSSLEAGSMVASALSFAAVAALMALRRDPGLATIGGMAAYFLLS